MVNRVLVCGSRTWSDGGIVWRTLDELNPTVIIEGCADGADRWAELWAKEHHVPIEHFPADWKHLGRAAGPIRNQAMLDGGAPDLVVGFDMGTSGTRDMLRKAGKTHVPIKVVYGSTPEVDDAG
jgi:hypothetical protein